MQRRLQGDRVTGNAMKNMGCVYFINVQDRDLFKVGKTKGKPEHRLNQLQTGSPDNLVLFGAIKTIDPVKLEREIHQKLKDCHCRGEWYHMDSKTAELFLAQYNGFQVWLKQFEGNDDSCGDFARDAKYAFETEIDPIRSNPRTFCDWIKVLDCARACREAKSVFLELWGMYMKQVSP